MDNLTDMIYRAKILATERNHKDLTIWTAPHTTARTSVYGVPIRTLPECLPPTYSQEEVYLTVNIRGRAFTTDLEGYIASDAGTTGNPYEFALVYNQEVGASVVPIMNSYSHSTLEEVSPESGDCPESKFRLPEGRAQVLMGDNGLSLIAKTLIRSELDRRVKEVSQMFSAREGWTVKLKPTPELTADMNTLLSRAGASPNFDYHPKEGIDYIGKVEAHVWGMLDGNPSETKATPVKVVDHNFPVKLLDREYKYNYYLHVGSDTEGNMSVGLLEALLANARSKAQEDDSLKIGDGWAFAQEETETDED